MRIVFKSVIFTLLPHKTKTNKQKKEDDHCPKTFGVDSFELKMNFLLNKFFYKHIKYLQK